MNIPMSTVTASGSQAAPRNPQILGHHGTASVHLTAAVCDYDHTRDVMSGAVRADGITLTPLVFDTIEEITFRFLKNLEWDVSELSFGKYTSLTSQGAAPMVAIPVFPSRVHRHSAIYVRADRGIKTAKDLNKRTIGIPEWAQTAGVYVRGFLAEDYGVDLSSIQWLAGGRQPAWTRREGCAQSAGRTSLRGAAGGEPVVDAG
jgi:4,5-dihydroxyphthalate decarboxylase